MANLNSGDAVRLFVLMSFDPAFADVYKLGIKAAATDVGLQAERVDEQLYAEGILERIYQQIAAADIIVADMTGQNANVFYEVGYAHGLRKLCILLTQKTDDIPFDLKHRRHIVYGGSIVTLKDELTIHLKWAMTQVENARKSRIKINAPQVTGNLEISQFFAEAAVEIAFDLHNESSAASAEVEAIYLYTGNEWNVKQAGEAARSNPSDVPKYKWRYFLSSPVRKLQKGAWAPLTISTRRQVASVFRDKKLPDKHHIKGDIMLRLVTTEGDFDYEFPMNIIVEQDVPF